MSDELHSKHTLRKSLFWAFTMNWGTQGLGMMASFGLAVLLGPTVFGTVAIALAFLSFIQVITAQGFEDALVQRQHLEEAHLDSAFWVIVACSLVFMGLSILGSHWWALLNHHPEVGDVLAVLSVRIPVYGLTIVQRAVLVRNLDFKALAFRSNVAEGIGGAVGIGMAFGGFGVWSLVGQHLSRDFSALFLLWKLSPWRPKWEFSLRKVKELVPFSAGVFATELGAYVQSQADVVLMGLFFGPTPVGLYRLADRLRQSVLSVACRAIEWIAMPRLAKVQHDPNALREHYLVLLKLNVILTAPAMLLLASASPTLVGMLGAKWQPAVGAIRFLCILGCFESVTYLTSSLLRSCSKPMVMAVLTWCFGLLNAAIVSVCGLYLQNANFKAQVDTVAFCKLAAFAVLYVPINLSLVRKFAQTSRRQLARTLFTGMLAAVVAGGVSFGARYLIADLNVPAVVNGGLVLGLGLLSAGVVIFLVEHGWRNQCAVMLRRLRAANL